MKLCSRCKQQKPLSSFPRNRSRLDGYSQYCKSCNNQINGDARRRDPERFKEYQRRYREKNRERRRKYDKERMRELRKKYPQKFKERDKTNSHRRRAAVFGA